MRAFLLLTAFNALFISGQSPSSWVQLTQAASEREKADDFAKAESLRREALRPGRRETRFVDAQLIPLLANLAATLHIKATTRRPILLYAAPTSSPSKLEIPN